MQDWSDDEVKTLRRMHGQGASATMIAAELTSKTIHQVRKAITRYRHELGLEYRLHPKQIDEPGGSFSCERCKELISKSWKG